MVNYVINKSPADLISKIEATIPSLFKFDFINNFNSLVKSTDPVTPIVLSSSEIKVSVGSGKSISLKGSGFAISGYNIADLVSKFENIVSSIGAFNSHATGIVSRISVVDNGVEIGSVQFTSSAWTFSSGRDSLVIRGALPTSFATINSIFTELFDSSGHLKTTFNPATSILSSIYISDINTYSEGNLRTSVHMDTQQITAAASDYKATLIGSFPNTFASFVDIARTLEAGGVPSAYSISGLKIENVVSGEITAQISGGTISAADLVNEVGSSGDDNFMTYVNFGFSVNLGPGNDIAVLAPDVLTAGPSNDPGKIDGGTGTDSISFANAAGGVRIELYGSMGYIYANNTTWNYKGSFDNFESITGSNFNDILNGSSGNDILNGGGGNDVTKGGAGNDKIDGGLGTNTAVFTGNRSRYNISKAADGTITVIDNNYFVGNDGTDTLKNIQTLQFADGVIQASNISSFVSTFGPRFEFVSTNYHPRVGVGSWNANQFFLTESPTGNYVKGSVNQMNVDISFQNNVGDFTTFDNTFNLGTAWSALTGTNGKPFLFSTNSDGSIKSGAFWFDKGSATGTSYSVKFESFNINLPTSTSMSYPYINNQSSVQTLLTGLNLNNYSWGNSSNNFGIFWETPVNTATNTKTENFAFFDTNGLAIGSGPTTLTVSSSAYPSFGGPDSDGNYILFTFTGSNGNLQLYNPTSLVTTNYGATGNFNIGFNSASITADDWNYTNKNSNGSFANYEIALSGVRNNQGVIDFYQLDAKTLTVTKTQTVTLSGSLGASRIQDIRLSDNSTTVFAYQDGAFLHLTEIGSDGTLISDYTQTLAAGAIFDRIRGLSNGLFEIVYRQPGAALNSMNYEVQLFDTRSGPLSVNNTSTTSPTNYAGTAFNDIISVSAANSMVMGSEGNDILTATSTSTNAILSYEYLNEGITANLSTGIVTANNTQGALVKSDTISGFKNIVGTLYNDSITGDSNSNMFWILGGNDTINGNGGTDYAEFYNNRTDYLIVQNGNSWTVTDRGTSPLSGTTTISNVQFLEFGWDGTTIDLTATPVNHAMSGAVTITGQAAVGQTLTASNNLSDADGTGAITYQWLRNGAIINGAATSTYQAVQADLGTVLSVKASYTDGWNVYNSATSNTVTVAASSTSVSGLSYFWNKSALGHALLNGVSVSVVGSGATAQSQLLLSNVTIDSSGNVTADVTANLSSAADSFDVYLSLGTNASNAVFTSALSSTNFSVISSPSNGGGLNISGYGNLSGSTTQLISSGQTKLGSISFNAGSLSQFQISVLAGTDFNNSNTGLQSNVTPYSYISNTTKTGADGSYTMQITSGNYTIGATNSPSNIGNAVTSADALAALKIAVGLNPNPSLSPSPYQIMSADYNHDGKVSAADALAILKAAVQYTGSTAPSWQFVSETADLSQISRTNSTYTPSISAVAGNFIQSMVGMIAGDVNGSWTPTSGSSYLETTNPNYFTQLSQKLSVPTSQWGV